jgi:hypothetical protein
VGQLPTSNVYYVTQHDMIYSDAFNAYASVVFSVRPISTNSIPMNAAGFKEESVCSSSKAVVGISNRPRGSVVAVHC